MENIFIMILINKNIFINQIILLTKTFSLILIIPTSSITKIIFIFILKNSLV